MKHEGFFTTKAQGILFYFKDTKDSLKRPDLSTLCALNTHSACLNDCLVVKNK